MSIRDQTAFREFRFEYIQRNQVTSSRWKQAQRIVLNLLNPEVDNACAGVVIPEYVRDWSLPRADAIAFVLSGTPFGRAQRNVRLQYTGFALLNFISSSGEENENDKNNNYSQNQNDEQDTQMQMIDEKQQQRQASVMPAEPTEFLYIDTICAKAGSGGALLQFIQNQLAPSLRTVTVISLNSTPASINFYRRFGFRNTHDRQRCTELPEISELAQAVQSLKFRDNDEASDNVEFRRFLQRLVDLHLAKIPTCETVEECNEEGYPMQYCLPNVT
jgi:hypothetical protein